jgi:dihydroorotate dehydrogenase
MYSLVRPLLFKLDPETAHQLTLQLIRLGRYQPLNSLLRAIYAVPEKPVNVFGLHFRNPVGLAAGYDKDGLAWGGLATLGFSHIEVGTVTPLPQPGNPKPRVFRLVEDGAVINRMGFPGHGADYLSEKISHRKRGGVILGVNLGKNKDTPIENAALDYISLMRQFSPLADYLVVNISSPNTTGLRRLQGRELLEGLLGSMSKERREFASSGKSNIPILVKLAPDLTEEGLDDALEVIVRSGMDGVIATNTTLGREGLHSKHAGESGGLSGDPLRGRSEAVLRSVVKKLEGRLPVVSVGGIMNPGDARARLDAGAALVQIYTGLVYAGPGLVRHIVRGLA